VDREDLEKLNEIIDRLTSIKFFDYSKELRYLYTYLADKYQFDLKTHTVDPATGEIVPINKNKSYFSDIV
jgi:6-phosphogluconolactonase (cycloisomerase 2 family)